MKKQETKFELARDIERYLAALSKLYAQEGRRQLQEIIVNAQIRVHEEWSYDNWDGGVWGHALFLVIPDAIFLNCVKQKDDIQNQISCTVLLMSSYSHVRFSATRALAQVSSDGPCQAKARGGDRPGDVPLHWAQPHAGGSPRVGEAL